MCMIGCGLMYIGYSLFNCSSQSVCCLPLLGRQLKLVSTHLRLFFARGLLRQKSHAECFADLLGL